jgi:hypothetical protein
MKRVILMVIITFNFLYVISQENFSFGLMPYFRAGFLAVKPTRPDLDWYTLQNEDVNYEGAVLGLGNEFLFNFKKISFGADFGYSSVFKNSYNGTPFNSTLSGNNKMSEIYIFPFIDLYLAKNFYIKFGIGGHYTFVKYDWIDPELSSFTTRESFTSFDFGLLGGIGKDFTLNDKSAISISLKANPIFSSTDYGFMMPVTLNLGFKTKL